MKAFGVIPGPKATWSMHPGAIIVPVDVIVTDGTAADHDAAPTPPVAIEWINLVDVNPDQSEWVMSACDRLRQSHGCDWFRMNHVDTHWVAIEGWVERPDNEGAPPTLADIPRGFV